MEPVLVDCVEPSPREPRAVDPLPATVTLAFGDLRGLISLAEDLAAWTETVDPGGELDAGDFDDLEQLGRRARELVSRLRRAGGA